MVVGVVWEFSGVVWRLLGVVSRFFKFWQVLGGFKEEDQHCRKPRRIINYFGGSPGFSFAPLIRKKVIN